MSVIQNIKKWNVVVAGLGGTGSNLVPHLCQLAYSLKGREDISIVLADGDVVEPDNIGRQFFIEPEVGEYKAPTLQRRYQNAWGVDISYHNNYIEDPEVLKKLLARKSLQQNSPFERVMPVLVGCVDNHYSRRVFHQVFYDVDNIIYIDAGNSEFSGQVVMGARYNSQTLLPPLGDYAEEIFTENDDIDRGGTCTRNIVKQPQNLAANLWAATNLFSYLNNIISLKTVPQYMTTFNGHNIVCRSEFMPEPKEGEESA